MKMPVTFAHAWLHRRTGLPIVPVHQEPLPGGRCRVVFHPRLEIPPDATDQEIAQLCWDQFEPVVRQNPSPWLWMYKYWRFRPTNATRLVSLLRAARAPFRRGADPDLALKACIVFARRLSVLVRRP